MKKKIDEKKRFKIGGIIITIFGAVFYLFSCVMIYLALKGIQGQEPFLSGWGGAEPTVIAQMAAPMVLANAASVLILFTGVSFLYESRNIKKQDDDSGKAE